MDLYIEGLTQGNISISGDEGSPALKVVGMSSTTVPVKDVLGNTQFCEECSTFIANSKIRVRVGNASGRILTADQMAAIQNGTLFDLDSDGITDMSEGATALVFEGLDLKDAVTELQATLPGNGTKKFLPIMATVICREANALNADATVDLSTSPGGGEWLSGAALNGLDAVDKALTISINTWTAIPAVADNATLYAKIASADTGTSGKCDLKVDGFFI